MKSQEDCKAILEELDAKLLQRSGHDNEKATAATVSEEEEKVAMFYRAGMDEASIESIGVTPLTPVLELCTQISQSINNDSSREQTAFLLGTLSRKYSIHPFLAIGSGPDKKDSAWSTAQIYQGGIALPDRDYYFDDDKKAKREEYKKFMCALLTLLMEAEGSDGTQQNVMELVEKVYALEESLARAHMTKTENRDPVTTYNKMSIEQLTELCNDAFDFASYLRGATGKSSQELGDVNVRNVKAIQCAASLIADIDSETLLGYLRFHTVCSCASYMGAKFVQVKFDFYEGVLQGTKEMKPRWKRVMEFTESALGKK